MPTSRASKDFGGRRFGVEDALTANRAGEHATIDDHKIARRAVALGVSALLAFAPVAARAAVESATVTLRLLRQRTPDELRRHRLSEHGYGQREQRLHRLARRRRGRRRPSPPPSTPGTKPTATPGSWSTAARSISRSTPTSTSARAIPPADSSPVIFTLSGASAALLSQLVWTQALVINYTPLAGSLSRPSRRSTPSASARTPRATTPTSRRPASTASSGASPSGGAFCDPIYPFQYGSNYVDRYARRRHAGRRSVLRCAARRMAGRELRGDHAAVRGRLRRPTR